MTNHSALVTPTPDVPDPTATNTPAPTNTGVPLEGAPSSAGNAATATPAAAETTATPEGTAVAEITEPETLNSLPVAHIFMGDLFIGTLDKLPGRSITLTPENDRRYLHFAPDGRMLVFTDVTGTQIRVMDAGTGLSPRRIADLW